MNVLLIINDQPYGSERPYNALRLATALSKREGVEVRVFLLGDAVSCAVAGEQLPEGHYHLDRMLKGLLHRAEVACCGTCMGSQPPRRARRRPGSRRRWKRDSRRRSRERSHARRGGSGRLSARAGSLGESSRQAKSSGASPLRTSSCTRPRGCRLRRSDALSSRTARSASLRPRPPGCRLLASPPRRPLHASTAPTLSSRQWRTCRDSSPVSREECGADVRCGALTAAC